MPSTSVFHIHGVDAKGRAVLPKRLRKSRLTDFFPNLPVCIIGMECTRGTRFWVLGIFGHTVQLNGPQFGKPHLTDRARQPM
jgi:transposase